MDGTIISWVRMMALAVLVCRAAMSVGGDLPDSPVYGDEPVSRFRLGPFYEERVEADGSVSTALRPFFSTVRTTDSQSRLTDILWPVSHSVSRDERRYGRVLNMAWFDDDVTRDDSRWSFLFFPIYFQGHTEAYGDFWSVFPIYGRVPNFMIVADDVEYLLFPLYLGYTGSGPKKIRTRYYLFPFYSVQEDPVTGEAPETDVTRGGIFPFYGSKHDANGDSQFILWPFWSTSVYDSPLRQGDAWMLFPFYGEIRTNMEKTWLALPPFIRCTTAERQGMVRIWPFYEDSFNPVVKRKRYWPFYGTSEHKGSRDWFALWPLGAGMDRTSEQDEASFSRFWPFWFRETRWAVAEDGTRTETSDYLRIWPFFARYARGDGRLHLRTLELFPLRNSSPLERNLVPFWTFYEYRRRADGTVENDLFWGIFKWSGDRVVPSTGSVHPEMPVADVPEDGLLGDLLDEVAPVP